MDLSNVFEDIHPTHLRSRKGKKPRLVQFHQVIFLKMKKNLNMTFQTKNSQLKCLTMSLTGNKAMMEYLKQFTLKMTNSNKVLGSKLNKLISEFQDFKREKDNEKKDLENSLNFIQSQCDDLMAEKEKLEARVSQLESTILDYTFVFHPSIPLQCFEQAK